MEQKSCSKCGVAKVLDDFYIQKRSSGLRFAACKDCVKRRVRENRIERIDYYKEFDARRYREQPARRAHAKRCHEKWSRSKRGKAVVRARKVAQAEQYSARSLLWSALLTGKLQRLPCEICGNPESEGHHDDYSKPLDVRWLCAKHHAEHHRIHGKSKRQEIAKTVPK